MPQLLEEAKTCSGHVEHTLDTDMTHDKAVKPIHIVADKSQYPWPNGPTSSLINTINV